MASIIDQGIDGFLLAGKYKPMQRKFNERVSIEACEYILSLSKDEFELEFWDPNELLNKDGEKWDSMHYWNEIRTWCATIVRSGDDSQSYVYQFPLNQKCGRLYSPKFCVQRLQNRIRSFVVRDYVVDVDMVNAHFTILKWLCNKEGVDCPYVDAYCANRKHLLTKHNLNKLDLIIAMYMDKPVKTSNSWHRKFLAELVEIRDYFNSKLHDYPDITFGQGSNSSKKNPKGSNLNRILCKYESEILQVAIAAVGTQNVHAPIFDGFHLDKAAHNESTIALLDAATTEWGVTWAIKPFEYDVKIPDEWSFDFKAWLETATDYESVKLRLEQNNARILEPACFVSRPDDSSPYVICNEKGFKHKTSACTYIEFSGGFPEHVSIFGKWMADPNHREYKNVDFIPDHELCPASTFNTFTGFKSAITETPVDTSILHEHLRDVIAAGDVILYEYLLNFEAHMLQKPCEIPRTSLLVKSKQQCGKDSLIDKWAAMQGEKYIHRTSSMNDITGSFTHALENKIVLQLNEMQSRDGFAAKEQLKDLITAQRVNINKKYQDPLSQRNCIRVVIFTNNDIAIEIPYDDQRFCVMQASDIWRGDKEKFGAYHAAICDQAVLDSYYTELMQRDISNFDPRVRPITKAYKVMQDVCVPEVYKVIRDNVDTFGLWGDVKGDSVYFTPVRFKSMYQKWQTDQGFDLKDYPRNFIHTKLANIPEANMKIKHRFDGEAAVNSWHFNIPELHKLMAEVFAE